MIVEYAIYFKGGIINKFNPDKVYSQSLGLTAGFRKIFFSGISFLVIKLHPLNLAA
ncbi:MAG: hypothetical protein WA896_17955 [Spirulinaceae cyanobacterium]